MGYCYARQSNGRMAIACDGGCGRAGGAQGVRKRPCRFKVSHLSYGVRHELPYCPAPALCAQCFKRHGGAKGLHGESCREGAAASQAREDEKQRRLAAGDAHPAAAWGSWCESVPEGKVGVSYQSQAGRRYVLVSAEDYKSRPWLSEVEHELWEGPRA